ncbi:MAG: acetyltransferase [Arcobacter sp.]|nr:MAG: acetyltransferase [Arcobacter sp.]
MKNNFADDVKIFEFAKLIYGKNNLFIGSQSQIDDFVFLNAGELCKIGRFVHISSFCSIIGGGNFIMEDFSGLSAGCRIITGSDDFKGPFLSNPTVPDSYKNVRMGSVIIRKHAIIGTNTIILPDVEIGEGTTVGANCLVNKDLEPWTIYAGSKPRKVGERDKDGVLDLERKFLKEYEGKL